MNKDDLIKKYNEFKQRNNRIPSKREFIEFSGIPRRLLDQIYGDNPYSKFQGDCGDSSNKLNLIRTPIEKIMCQFGELAIELGKLPTQANWEHKGFQPTISGLEKPPHLLKWSDFPFKFREWVLSQETTKFPQVLELIEKLSPKRDSRVANVDKEFEKLILDVRSWSPSRRRNTEEVYKVELRNHLETLGYHVDEEFGESKFDLLVNNRFAVEIKKDPNLADYDRLFGQLARHLQYQTHLIALIFDAPTEDKFKNFVYLVERFLNKEERQIEVIKK